MGVGGYRGAVRGLGTSWMCRPREFAEGVLRRREMVRDVAGVSAV